MTSLAVVGFEAHIRDLRHMEARAASDLADWLVHLKVKRYSDRTVYGYSRVIARLLRKFPDKAFGDFTDSDIEAVLLESGERSGHIDRAIFNQWFKWGYVKRRIDGNPVDRVAHIRHPRRRPIEIFTDAEIALLENLPRPHGPMFTILLGTGIRRGEARKLRMGDVNMERSKLAVLAGKGNKDRVINFPLSVYAAFKKLRDKFELQRDEHPWVFACQAERNWYTRRYRTHPVGDTTFEKWYTRCIEQAGVRYLHPHTTRHTYGWRLRDSAFDLEERSFLMGHEDPSTTKKYYGRLTADDLAEKMALVDW